MSWPSSVVQSGGAYVSTRRRFFASLLKRPASLLSERRFKQTSEDSAVERTQSAGSHKFGLRTLFVVITIVCVLLGLLRTDAELGLVVGFVAVITIVELYRSRLRSTLGDDNYSRLATFLRCAGGASSGAILGAIGGALWQRSLCRGTYLISGPLSGSGLESASCSASSTRALQCRA
jgi:hypothetical protein